MTWCTYIYSVRWMTAEMCRPHVYLGYQHLKHIQIQLYNIWIAFTLTLEPTEIETVR